MKKYAIQFLAALPGVIMLRNAVGLLVTPTHVLDDLGMPMLNGLARNTELSDLTAFFLAATGFIFYGAIRSAPSWLYASAWMLGLAAAGRVFTWAAQGAAFATTLFIIECVLTLWLIVSAWLLGRAS